MKIAIIGGSFDPIHNGHLAMARYVLHHHLADQVWFMVSAQTPLKARRLSPFAIRAAMVKQALAYDFDMKVCTLEQEREGLSYSVDTVRECQKRWPMHSFVWLIGNDQAAQLEAWKDIDALSEMIEFYVFPRNGEAINCAYAHREMKMALMDISSSEIRNGQKLWQLPKTTARYIADHGLYIESMAKARLSERRFAHSQSVARLCVTLAKCHGVNLDQAYAAGILHDICKEWDQQRLACWLRALDQKKLDEAAPIWHGYVGAYYISKGLGIHDKAIRNAIYHHVLGSSRNQLAMILYISDKLDPSRGYECDATLALCRSNLRQGFEQVKKEQREYLKKEQEIVHES